MDKTAFINKVHERTGLNKVQSQAAVNAMLDIIREEVAAGNDVQFVKFGTFTTITKQSRPGRNLRTGEAITIPEHKAIKFKPGKTFRDMVN